jgi:hypothetical protein
LSIPAGHPATVSVKDHCRKAAFFLFQFVASPSLSKSGCKGKKIFSFKARKGEKFFFFFLPSKVGLFFEADLHQTPFQSLLHPVNAMLL